MSRRISLITIFVLLNLGIGRMFQETLSIICFSELSIIAITSFFFWNASSGSIKNWSTRWAVAPSGKTLAIQGGIGISASLLNVLMGQLLVIFLMTTVYGCTTPSFNFLNATLTNNIAVNLLCYFALLFYFTGHARGESVQENSSEGPNPRISITKNGSQFLLEPKEIVFVETSNNCIIVHTEKGRFVKYQSLKSFSKKLCPQTFKRVHRSFLLNTTYVDRIKKNKNGDGTVHLSTGSLLKFSRNYVHNLLNV